MPADYVPQKLEPYPGILGRNPRLYTVGVFHSVDVYRTPLQTTMNKCSGHQRKISESVLRCRRSTFIVALAMHMYECAVNKHFTHSYLTTVCTFLKRRLFFFFLVSRVFHTLDCFPFENSRSRVPLVEAPLLVPPQSSRRSIILAKVCAPVLFL